MGKPVKRSLGFRLVIMALLLAGPSARAWADGAACTARVIQLQQTGVDFDQRLEPLRHKLTSPPFSMYKSVHLLDQSDLHLPKEGAAASISLPGGHEGMVKFMGRVDGPKHKRVRIHLTIKDGPANLLNNDFLIDSGGTYFYAGMKNAGGVLALALTCRLHEQP